MWVNSKEYPISQVRSARPGRFGVTLIEVLSAIFVTGIGLLAILVLFPLGALSMAQAIKDDRTAAIADAAIELNEVGLELLSETEVFIRESLSNGFADPQATAELREGYQSLALKAEEIEVQLLDIQSIFPKRKVKRHVPLLLTQIRLIKLESDTIDYLLSLVEDGLK
jgi:hypothetical protein